MCTLKLLCVLYFRSLGWFSYSSAVISCQQLLTADGSCHEKKNKWNFRFHPKGDICAEFELPRLNFIVISCHQLSWAFMTAFMKKIKCYFHLHPNGNICAKLKLSGLIFIVISCQQLLPVTDSCHEKYSNGIVIFTLMVIYVPNFRSLGWFSLSSAVNSCWELMIAVTKKIQKQFYFTP